MFTFDNTTIIASVVLILVAVLTSLLNPFFRRVGIVAYGLPSSTNESDDTSTEEEPEEEGKETIAEPDDKAEEHPSLPPYLNYLHAPRQCTGACKEPPTLSESGLSSRLSGDCRWAPQNIMRQVDVLKRFCFQHPSIHHLHP